MRKDGKALPPSQELIRVNAHITSDTARMEGGLKRQRENCLANEKSGVSLPSVTEDCCLVDGSSVC